MTVQDDSRPGWAEWDSKVHDRSDIAGNLAASTDEDLVELLAGASRRDRKYERDIIATEVLNRMHRRQRDLPKRASHVLDSAKSAHEAAADGQHAIHKAEGLLRQNGEEALGAEVSAAAYASLDTTKAALADAHTNDASVRSATSKSRHGGPAGDAVAAGKRGVAAGQDAASALDKMGRGKEGSAARDAASRISTTADDASKAAGDE